MSLIERFKPQNLPLFLTCFHSYLSPPYQTDKPGFGHYYYPYYQPACRRHKENNKNTRWIYVNLTIVVQAKRSCKQDY